MSQLDRSKRPPRGRVKRRARSGLAEPRRSGEILQEEEMAGWLREHLPEVTKQFFERERPGETAKR